MSQSSDFKSRPDLVTLGGVGGGNLKSWKFLLAIRANPVLNLTSFFRS